MTKDEVQAIVERYAPEMVDRMRLNDWNLQMFYDAAPPASESHQAEGGVMRGWCHCLPEYRLAEIHLICPNFKTAEAIMRTVRHELLHVLIAEIDALADVGYAACGDNIPACQMLDRVRLHTHERIVRSLERLLDDGIGDRGGVWSSKAIADLGAGLGTQIVSEVTPYEALRNVVDPDTAIDALEMLGVRVATPPEFPGKYGPAAEPVSAEPTQASPQPVDKPVEEDGFDPGDGKCARCEGDTEFPHGTNCPLRPTVVRVNTQGDVQPPSVPWE